jgi:diadenosine tetraphosphate (Ap4A) HIT family hydrolase
MNQTMHAENNESAPEFVSGCLFCELPADKFQVIDENDLCLALTDSYPVTAGHCLIIPRRHATTYFEMNAAETLAANHLLQQSRERIEQMDATVSGFNIGMNCGKSAGQSVFHAHIHLIPRRDGDQQNPQGGVRKIFPEKAHYRRG